jgi:hypothetical protein
MSGVWTSGLSGLKAVCPGEGCAPRHCHVNQKLHHLLRFEGFCLMPLSYCAHSLATPNTQQTTHIRRTSLSPVSGCIARNSTFFFVTELTQLQKPKTIFRFYPRESEVAVGRVSAPHYCRVGVLSVVGWNRTGIAIVCGLF